MSQYSIWNEEVCPTDAEIAQYRNDCQDIYPEIVDASNEEVSRMMEEDNYNLLGDERMNLDKTLSGKVIVIARLGLWNGHPSAYKILSDNLNCVLDHQVEGSASMLSVYGDGKDIRADESHHDGVNHYLFRMLKGDDYEELTDAIYNGQEVTQELLDKYTESLFPEVAKVYGWTVEQPVATH